MSTLKEFMDMGKEAGLAGEQLLSWAKTELNEAAEAAELKEAKAAEAATLAYERELRLLDRKAAIATAEAAIKAAEAPPPPAPPKEHINYKFSSFNEKNEDINAFLNQFERQCALYKISEANWPLHISPLLSGSCRDIFLNLPMPYKYSDVKRALLSKFQQTKEAYRKKFFSASPARNESLTCYIERLKQIFKKWIELSNTEDTFGGLFDLLLRDRIYSSCNTKFVSFTQEREVSSVEDILALGERYFEAHPDQALAGQTEELPFIANHAESGRGRQNRRFEDVRNARSKSYSSDTRSRGNYNSGYQSNRGPQNEPNRYPDNQRRNFIPGNQNWNYSHNYQNKNDSQDFRSFANNSKPNSTNSRQNQFRTCYKCGSPKHLMSACPKLKTAMSASTCDPWPRGMSPSDVSMFPGEFPAMSARESGNNLEKHLYPGFVGNKEVSVLRDTGANVHGVLKHLVPPDSYTGKTVRCLLFGGRIEHFREVSISVDTPFFTGNILACELDRGVADLIIGNGEDIQVVSPERLSEWEAHRSRPVHASVVDCLLDETDSESDPTEILNLTVPLSRQDPPTLTPIIGEPMTQSVLDAFANVVTRAQSKPQSKTKEILSDIFMPSYIKSCPFHIRESWSNFTPDKG